MRNPKWHRDEIILALDLYFSPDRGSIDDKNPKVIVLSRVLNALPLFPERPDEGKFRNPNGVALKLANFLPFDSTYHAEGVSQIDYAKAFVRSRYQTCKARHRVFYRLRQQRRQPIQPKVFNRIICHVPILEREKFVLGLFPHQNRLELLAPPFLSREKVASSFHQFSKLVPIESCLGPIML